MLRRRSIREYNEGMNQDDLNLYTDYLSVTFGAATATGLSELLDGEISPDQFTRFLGREEFTSKDWWKPVKPTVRKVERDDGRLIFDETIAEKAWMDENELRAWHYDPSKGRNVKGINLLNCLYPVRGVSIPVALELVRKPSRYCEVKTKREKRCREVTKNELMRELMDNCVKTQLPFNWVLFEIGFGSVENREHIKLKHGKDFVGAITSHRLVALTEEDRKTGCFIRVEPIEWSEPQVITAWLKGLSFPVRLRSQVFTNQDGSVGILHLASSQLTSDWDTITTIYQKRGKVEVFHNS